MSSNLQVLEEKKHCPLNLDSINAQWHNEEFHRLNLGLPGIYQIGFYIKIVKVGITFKVFVTWATWLIVIKDS